MYFRASPVSLALVLFYATAVSGLVGSITNRPNPVLAATREALSEIDLMAIENVAELCLSAEAMVDDCDLDEHEALVNTLTEQHDILEQQRDNLNGHLEYLDKVLSRLSGHEVNGHSLDENEIEYDQ